MALNSPGSIERSNLLSRENTFKYSTGQRAEKILHDRNVDCKTLFFTDEQNIYAEKTQGMISDALKHNREALGDFYDLNEPLEFT